MPDAFDMLGVAREQERRTQEEKRAASHPYRFGGGHTYQSQYADSGGRDPSFAGQIDARKPQLFQVDQGIRGRAEEGFAGYEDLASQLLADAHGRGAPQMGPVEDRMGQQARMGQMELANALRERAYGQKPSAAEMQLQRGLEQSNALAMGQARSAQGANPALAARMAQNAQSQNAQAMNAQAAQLRAQEQAQAEATLGNVFAGVRGQDIGTRGQDIGIGQTNLQAQLTAEQQRQQAMQAYLGAGQQALGAGVEAGFRSEDLQRQGLADYFNAINKRRADSKDGFDKAKSVPLIGSL